MAFDTLPSSSTSYPSPFAASPRPRRILLAVLILASVLLISQWAREGDSGVLHRIQGGLSSAISPIASLGARAETVSDVAATAVSDTTASTATLSSLEEENESLKEQIAQMSEYQAQNERLTALLNINSLYNLESVGATITNRTTDSYNRTVTIDKGTSTGLSVGMVVMSANGLVGQIISIGSESATVRLVSDEQSGVSAMLQSSRVTGVVSGSLDGLLYLEYISTSDTVNVGDVVVTSGLGGVYPKGIVIGTVVSVSGVSSDLYHTIVVEPISAVSSFEEVLVLTGSQTEVTTPTIDQLTAVGSSNTTNTTDTAASSNTTTSSDANVNTTTTSKTGD
jgi:rod shape-determining protein MreC